MDTRRIALALGAVALMGVNLTTCWSLQRERAATRLAREERDALDTQLLRANAAKEEVESRLQRVRRANERVDAAPDSTGATNAGGVVLGSLGRATTMHPLAHLTRAQRKLIARQGRGELFRELGLSEQEIDALLDLEIERENALWTAQTERDDPDEPLAPAELSAQLEAQASKHQSAVISVLGAQKAAALQRLEATLPLRSEVRMVREHLEGMGLALDDAQRTKLTQAVTSQPLSAPVIEPAMTPDEMRAQVLAFTEGRQHRLRDAAKTIFTPEQLAALDAYHDLHRAMQESAASNASAVSIAGPSAPLP